MYIGDTGSRGLHHLVYEAVDNAIDEAMAGHAHDIYVTVNGRRLGCRSPTTAAASPSKSIPNLGISTLQGVMTVLKFGGKFDKQAYKTSGGLARHRRQGGQLPFRMVRSRSPPRRASSTSRNISAACRPATSAASAAPPAPARKSRSSPTRKCSAARSSNTTSSIAALQELAFLNRGTRITLKDDRTGDGETFHYERGLLQFVEYPQSGQRTGPFRHHLHRQGARRRRHRSGDAIHVRIHRECSHLREQYHTVDGGTHLSGFRTGPDPHAEQLRQEEPICSRTSIRPARISAKG